MESSPKSEAWLEAMPANVSNLKMQKSASARRQRAHLVLAERQNKKKEAETCCQASASSHSLEIEPTLDYLSILIFLVEALEALLIESCRFHCI